MNLIFTPDMICYGMIYPTSPTTLSVGGGLFTFGGWIVPKATADLPDFYERGARLMEGSRQLGEQDTAVNLSMQAAKVSRYAPRGRLCYLEETLSQFSRWLANKYHAQVARVEGQAARVEGQPARPAMREKIRALRPEAAMKYTARRKSAPSCRAGSSRAPAAGWVRSPALPSASKT